MRLINAIAYRRVLEEEKDYQLEHCKDSFKCRCGLEIAIADLGDMPTIDAVPVVRCPLCKYHMVYKEKDGNGSYLGCTRPWGIRGALAPDDFCSYGEQRKEAEGDV